MYFQGGIEVQQAVAVTGLMESNLGRRQFRANVGAGAVAGGPRFRP